MNNSLKQTLVDLSKKFDLDLLVLFGSRAKGYCTNNSDWDFAFLKKNITNYERKKLLIELIDILKTDKIDLIDLNKIDNIVLKYEIFNNGICIYEKQEGLFELNETNTWFNFVFYKDSIDLQNKNIENELHNL
jgi:predicted nucleotidyltransferase